MKAVAILLSIVAFIACLILGIQAGSQSLTPTTPQATATTNPWTSSTQQRNIILIVADDLQIPNPRLVAVWVMLYRPDMPQVTLLPLYPPSTVTTTATPPDLAGTFGLSNELEPAAAFITSLRAYKLDWNGYLLTDQLGLARTVDWLGGIQLSEATADGAAALGSLVNPWDDPLGALRSQQNFIQAVCVKVATLKPEANWLELAGTLLPQHLHTSLSLELAIADWKTLASGAQAIHCEAPIQ